MSTEEATELPDLDSLDAYRRALADFAEALVELHVNSDAPTLRQVEAGARADGRCFLSVSAISEALNGKRLPSLDFTAELVRQLTSNNGELAQERTARWRNVKRLQRRARATRQRECQPETHDDVPRERKDRSTGGTSAGAPESPASATTDAQAEAEKILADAKTHAMRVLEEAEEESRRLRSEAHTALRKIESATEIPLGELEDLLAAGRAALRERLRQRSSLRIALLGPPGAGKGTQGTYLAKELDVPKVLLGDVIRSSIARGSKFGQIAKGCIESETLMSDVLLASMIFERLAESDVRRGFLLDDFPRNLNQVDMLAEWLAARGVKMDMALLIDIPEEEALMRYEGRRICSHDRNHIFHLQHLPPKRYGICDSCGGTLTLRADDSALIVRKRYAVYREEVTKVIERHESESQLVGISGLGGVADCTRRAVDGLAMKAAQIDGLCSRRESPLTEG
ncbi:nucleoside monophosphate kinase [Streptomyces sp. DSM 41527]|uniref:Adenylate kinase n=1 Tax=Streptomyces mooreae TaxID=3075523 RepID=A0ABU2TAX1_9ACTN|nr:nucleoside monophosphate kinase [Streptomyces sp. DSM 41527]MDT0458089.1 nucleoside monophosphate kinase [Streptomyces sp. DSM 41527]